MAQVDFYILAVPPGPETERFACRLAVKAASAGSVFVRTDDAAMARRIDEALWTFQDVSFLPHALTMDADELTPVVIGPEPGPLAQPAVCINLAAQAPLALLELAEPPRVLEITPAGDAAREAGRGRYRAWQQAGVTPDTHKIGA